jgi:hypothetical protein
LVEQPIRNRQVSGSSPLVGSILDPGILLVALALIVFLSLRGMLDATVGALLSTVLGYGLRSTAKTASNFLHISDGKSQK